MLGERRAESERSHVVPPEIDDGTFPSKLLPYGDTQINRDGLN